MPKDSLRLWRVVPFDPDAHEGMHFSASYLPTPQGSGRFDISSGSVLYLAEDPEHAIAEKLARYRGATLRDVHLMEFHRRLAILPVDILADISGKIVDLCDPANQIELSIRSDQLASEERAVTQDIAQRIYLGGSYGLRWWSSIRGAWHAVVIFTDRLTAKQIKYGPADFLSLDHPLVKTTAKILGMKLK